MGEIEQMDLFGSVKHTDDNLDLPEIVNASSSNDLLDYMALVVARYLNADKILAILSRKRFRRTKDLYDFYVLTSKFNFKYAELVNCIHNRDNYDDSVWENIPFSDTSLVEHKRAWERLELIAGINGRSIDKPEFKNCIHRFYSIALKNTIYLSKITAGASS